MCSYSLLRLDEAGCGDFEHSLRALRMCVVTEKEHSVCLPFKCPPWHLKDCSVGGVGAATVRRGAPSVE